MCITSNVILIHEITFIYQILQGVRIAEAHIICFVEDINFLIKAHICHIRQSLICTESDINQFSNPIISPPAICWCQNITRDRDVSYVCRMDKGIHGWIIVFGHVTYRNHKCKGPKLCIFFHHLFCSPSISAKNTETWLSIKAREHLQPFTISVWFPEQTQFRHIS